MCLFERSGQGDPRKVSSAGDWWHSWRWIVAKQLAARSVRSAVDRPTPAQATYDTANAGIAKTRPNQSREAFAARHSTAALGVRHVEDRPVI